MGSESGSGSSSSRLKANVNAQGISDSLSLFKWKWDSKGKWKRVNSCVRRFRWLILCHYVICAGCLESFTLSCVSKK